MSFAKSPHIIFFRAEKYAADIDPLLEAERGKVACTFHITSNYDDVLKLFNPNFPVLATYATDTNESEYLQGISSRITQRMHSRWLHFGKINADNLHEVVRGLTFCFIQNCVLEKRNRPVFSLFTTCFNTFDKIHRVYESLKAQRLRDWEWVMVDDSTDEKHFDFLKTTLGDDPRVRLYKRSGNSANIGCVKNEVVGLCRGEYLLELDHDDELMPYTLELAEKTFRENADVGFVYMDFVNMHENGGTYWFGDWVSRGYAGYYAVKVKGRWQYVYHTANVNNITVGFLTSLPNHPRIWRKSVLDQIGSYCEYLPVADDLEVLLRTAMHTKMAKIPVVGYIQYMNESSGNFSWMRNEEIQRLGRFIQPQFYASHPVVEHFKSMDAHEDERYMWKDFEKIWKRGPDYEHRYANLVVAPYKRQYLILGVDQLDHPDFLNVWSQRTADDDFMVISDLPYDDLFAHLDRFGFGSVKCVSMKDESRDERVRFFERLYQSCDTYTLFESTARSEWRACTKVDREHASRASIVNEKLVHPEDTDYLEIGVETGMTFQAVKAHRKVGVDPDPIDGDVRIERKTSDDFFASNSQRFDAAFIDGMHQCDYVVRDLANTLRVLKPDGGKKYIFIDDVMPRDEKEQRRIPVHHVYENGILKYRCPWTGDVWIAVYDLLLKHGHQVKLEVFTHPSYRGVACLEIQEPFEYEPPTLEELLDRYSYEGDFDEYLRLLITLLNRE